MGDNTDVMGVYSYSREHESEVGERNSRHRHGTYWYVRRIDDDIYEVRPINANHVPSGTPKRITRERFLKSYSPELNYYEHNTLPCLETLRKKVRLGRRYFNLGLLSEAEQAFAKAVVIQEDSIPGNIGLSQVYAEQQEFTKLRAVLDKLLNIDEVFREEQRHRFNEFGINLRKKGLFDDAIRFYSKALEVNEKDENLHFNIARAFHGKDQEEQCRNHLKRALELAPDMAEAKSFLCAIHPEKKTQGTLKKKTPKIATRRKGLFKKKKKTGNTPKNGKGNGKIYVFDI